MALTKKQIFLRASAGVAAAAVLAFGVVQCNGRQNAEDERDTAKDVMNEAAARADSLLNVAAENAKKANEAMEDVLLVVNDQKNKLEVAGDSIVVLNDSIDVLNDSLTVVNGRLVECQKSKKKAVAPVKKKKTAPTPVVRPEPVAPATRPTQPSQPVQPAKSGVDVSYGHGVSHAGAVNVNQGADKSGNVSVSYGNNAQHAGDVNINNGTINNINNNNYYPETPTKNSSASAARTYVIRRVITR